MLDAWIRLDESGKLTVFTGKAELGTGVRTAFIQIAAEELDVALEAVHIWSPPIPRHAQRRLYRRQPFAGRQRHPPS